MSDNTTEDNGVKSAYQIYIGERDLLTQEYNGCIARMASMSSPDMLWRNRQQIEAARKAIVDLDKAYALKVELDQATIDGVVPGERPAIVGVHSHYVYNTSATSTSAYGTPYNLEYWYNVICGIAGLTTDHDGNNLNENYVNFEFPALLLPNVPQKIFNPFSEGKARPNDTSNTYNYAPKMFIIKALANTTGAAIDIPISFKGTSYGSYTGAGVYVILPDTESSREAKGVNVYNYTSNNGTSNHSTTYSLGAGETAIFIIYSSERVHDTSNGHYARNLLLRDVSAMYPTGVQANKQVLKNILECKVATFGGLFTATPS